MKRILLILAACACACAWAGVASARLGSLGRNDTVVTNVTDVTPGNYAAVSNAAMNARSMTDLGVRGAPQGEGSWFTINGERLDYNDGVWGERSSWRFIDMLGEMYYFNPNESGSGMEFSLDQDYKAIVDGYVIIGYTNMLAQVSQIPVVSGYATHQQATNAAIAVADEKIGTNNAAFVSAVLAVPLTGADAGDLAEIAEYGGYGTVGAAILALIAGLAALKRRVTSAETALAQKASLTDLPYRLVEPGVWKFSDGQVHTITGPAASIGGYNYYADSLYASQEFETEADALDALMLNFTEFTATRASLPGHLCDRAVNAVPVSTDTELNLPALEHAGKARDLLVRLEISGSTVPTITFAAPTGETLTYETDGDEFPVPDEAGNWVYSFTESCVAHKFAVSLKKVNTVAQGGS